MIFLRQATARSVILGPFFDVENNLVLPDLLITSADIQLSKNAQTLSQKNEASNAVYDKNGCYSCLLDATDTGTFGSLQAVIVLPNTLPVFHDFMVISQSQYDSMFSTEKPEVQLVDEDKTEILTAIAAASSGAGAIEWTYVLTRSDNQLPIADANVWVTTDIHNANMIASGQTDQNGQVTFFLNPGTVYIWRQKAGFNFSNPDVETVV